MKRPFQLVAEIQDKDAEIERLNNMLAATQVELDGADKVIANLKAEREEWQATLLAHRSLLTRAADALSDWVSALPEHVGDADKELVKELREAAE